MSTTIEEIDGRARAARDRLTPFHTEVNRVLVGQSTLVDRLLIGLLTDGHILLEGVPGLAKTLAVRTVAQVLHLDFRRIQFTPDLLPADVVGTQIYNPRSGEFSVKKGPVFANVILADEINRAPAKVQSALLEAMQEKQVTIGEGTYQLPKPFLVLATQNPLEQEGTYPLPEAQLDRFMMKVLIDYPSRDEELTILDRMGSISPKIDVSAVLSAEELESLRRAVDEIHVDAKIKGYIVDLVHSTRNPAKYGLEMSGLIQYGASPRATLALVKAARARALLDGRGYVTPQDVKAMAPDVMRHRVLVSYEAEAEELKSETLIERILNQLPVP
jgi:MoxR-like ATPase